jgi:DNA-binding MarR family transcriptional regulator
MKIPYQVGFLLSRTTWAMNNSVNRMLRENELADISVAYFAVLQALWGMDGLSISDLGERVQLEKSTMTSLIDRMEAAGLVRRDDHPTDRRAYRICITARSRELEEKLDQVVTEAYNRLTRGVPGKDLQTAIEVLKGIMNNAGETKEEGGR